MDLEGFKELSTSEQEEYIDGLMEKEAVTPAEREIVAYYYRHVERPATTRGLRCTCGREYEIHVDILDDGESPDGLNTSIYVVNVDKSDE